MLVGDDVLFYVFLLGGVLGVEFVSFWMVVVFGVEVEYKLVGILFCLLLKVD